MKFKRVNSVLIDINTIIKYARIKGYDIFEDNGNYNLNIWFIRNANSKAGRFDDIQIIFWKHEGLWYKQVYTCTTDPGKYYLLKPLTKYGTAIVKPGQYSGVFRFGYHKGDKAHPALVQRGLITVIRDFNKDTNLDSNVLDYNNIHIKSNGDIKEYYVDGKLLRREQEGYFGINNHLASNTGISRYVGKHSAGCLVQNDAKRYYSEFIPTIENAVEIWGNNFTATIVTETDMLKQLYAIK